MIIRENINEAQVPYVMEALIQEIHAQGPISSDHFETLAHIKRKFPEIFSQYENTLLYLTGLFYKTEKPNSFLEEVYSMMSDEINQSSNNKFTPVQASAFAEINNNKYFSFSAPTSAGKSYLFKEIIRTTSGDVVIIVPSRALIAEYIENILQIAEPTDLVLQFVENINTKKAKKRIYVITPERGDELFKFEKILNIELFLFDEAQLSDDPFRGIRFDSLIRRINASFPNAKKVFTHPFVENPEAQLKRHKIRTDSTAHCYRQNAVGKIYIVKDGNTFSYFSPFNKTPEKDIVSGVPDYAEQIIANNRTLLVYTPKSKIYNGTYINGFEKYIDQCQETKDPLALEIIYELQEFIGATKSAAKHSSLIEMMHKGIVIHHGSIPLKARLLIEKFVNSNYARICFATATLTQGINMPFDMVWLHHFKFTGKDAHKALELKNLIGRAGRSTPGHEWEYGYVVVEKANLKTFCKRLKEDTKLNDKSFLEEPLESIHVDQKDTAEASKNNSFNPEFQLTNKQVERLRNAPLDDKISVLLNNLIVDGRALTSAEYYKIKKSLRNKIKAAFQDIFLAHLRRKRLVDGEKRILSTAVPILLMQIQGKSFKEIVSLRLNYLTRGDEQREIKKREKQNLITSVEAKKLISELKIKWTQPASQLPDKSARAYPLIRGTIDKLKYDLVVYDTYDYIDKVIAISISSPIAAALQLYYDKWSDDRALILKNYVKYGTNDPTEIWLLRYGFGFEDVEWIKHFVKSIDEKEIVFYPTIGEVENKQYAIVQRFI